MNNLSRRTILKGLGAALALPTLNSLGANKSGLKKAPLRFIPLFMPNGAHPSCWDIKNKGGTNYKLAPAMKSLIKFKKDIIPISNLCQKNSSHNNHGPLQQHFLTSDRTSIDQYLAQKIGQDTRFSAMNLGVEPPKGGEIFHQCAPFYKKGAVIVPEIYPQMIFDRLFQSNSKQNNLQRKSVLDIVLSEIKSIQKRTSKEDRLKIDEYITSVRQVEKSIEKTLNPDVSKRWKSPTWSKRKIIRRPDALPPTNKDEHIELIIDLMVLAMWSDQSRVISLTMGHDFGGEGFSFIPGVKLTHHQSSHCGKDEDKIKQYSSITEWHVQKFASLINKMKMINEGNGTLLDNSLLFFGSCMKVGDTHSPDNLPIILAGGACGQLKTGSHLVLKEKTKHHNLLVSIMNMMGSPCEKFGRSDGSVNLPS